MKALITGGTGTLGRLVVPRLRDAGGDIRVLSRHRPEVNGGHRVCDRRPRNRRGNRCRGGGNRDHRPLRRQREGRRGQG